RLLLDAADPRHLAVQLNLSCRGDPVAVVYVAAASLHQFEREGKTGRRPAHLAQVEADVEREVDVERLDRQHADDRSLRRGYVARRLDRNVVQLPATPVAKAHDLADFFPFEDRAQ